MIDYFVLCDIWSTVVNYFQKILSPPQKKSTPSPIKDSTSASPPFLPPLNIFQAPRQKWGGGVRTLWIHLLNHFIFFSRQCKNKVMLGHSSFQLYEDKKSKWVLYNFKAALDYSSLYIFLYCDTTLVPPPP